MTANYMLSMRNQENNEVFKKKGYLRGSSFHPAESRGSRENHGQKKRKKDAGEKWEGG